MCGRKTNRRDRRKRRRQSIPGGPSEGSLSAKIYRPWALSAVLSWPGQKLRAAVSMTALVSQEQQVEAVGQSMAQRRVEMPICSATGPPVVGFCRDRVLKAAVSDARGQSSVEPSDWLSQAVVDGVGKIRRGGEGVGDAAS